MSLWYSCTFAAIGTDAEIKKLNAECDTYWHHARVEKRLSPGFVQVQASRNYGAHDAIEKMVADFPGVIFVGSLYDDQNFGNECIDKSGDVDSCQWWRFHGLMGLVGWQEMLALPKSDGQYHLGNARAPSELRIGTLAEFFQAVTQEASAGNPLLPYNLWSWLTTWLVANTKGEGENPWERLKADIDLMREDMG